MIYPMTAERVFNTPLLIDPRKGAAILAGVGPKLFGGEIVLKSHIEDNNGPAQGNAAQPLASLLGGELETHLKRTDRKGYAVVNGVAVISVTGTLVHRGAYVGESSGVRSYEGVRAQIQAAIVDDTVFAIALEFDSSGGEVAGCFDLCDEIAAARMQKPIWSFVGEHAYSAAYALASQADHIVMPRTGGVGSIGVVCMHADLSEALSNDGINVTFIHAGSHKVDGNSAEPLKDGVREDWELRMEVYRDLFVETIEQGRGDRFSADDARDTEAQCYMAADALELGLVDEVSDIRSAFQRFTEKVQSGEVVPRQAAIVAKTEGGQIMATKKVAGATKTKTAASQTDNSAAADASDDVDVEAPAAKTEEAKPTAGAETTVSSTVEASGEKDRIKAILDSPEAEGREKQAKHLAFNTDMDATAAIEVLKTGEKSAPEAGSLGLGDAMAKTADLEVGGEESSAKTPSMKERAEARFKK